MGEKAEGHLYFSFYSHWYGFIYLPVDVFFNSNLLVNMHFPLSHVQKLSSVIYPGFGATFQENRNSTCENSSA